MTPAKFIKNWAICWCYKSALRRGHMNVLLLRFVYKYWRNIDIPNMLEDKHDIYFPHISFFRNTNK